MNNKECEIAKETISKIISKELDDDINYGKELLDICKRKLNPCPIRDSAIIYMDNMRLKYGAFNVLYNSINGNKVSNGTSNVSSCYFLEKQIWVIEQVKKVKDLADGIDDIDKIKKLVELLKEEK